MTLQDFDGGITPPPTSIDRIALSDILCRTADRLPDNIALIDGDRRVTYRDLDEMVNRLTRHLIAVGCKSGHRCATIGANSVELVVSIFAIHRANLIWVPINLMLEEADVRYTLEHSGVSHVIMEPGFLDKPHLGGVVKDLGLPVILAEPGLPVCAHEMSTNPDIEIGPNDIAVIMYTSGTTSRPKGAMHLHRSIYMAAMGNALEMQVSRKDGIPLMLPLFHCGAHILMLTFILVGGRCALMRSFDAGDMLSKIDAEKLTLIVGLPSMYDAMLKHASWPDRDTTSLRLCIHTMAPMTEGLMRRLVKQFCPNFMQTSGQTEAYPATTYSQPDVQLERFGNIWGEPSVNSQMAIMGPDGAILPKGEIGELVHRGVNVMYGYYRDQQATDEARLHGWHHTGDVGRITANGEFEFLDRTKDIIKSGGENVSSMQVEAHLLDFPGVVEAVVVGLPHPRWGEAVTGFVVMAQGHLQDPDAIMRHLQGVLSRFQSPKRIIFVDALPKTATGKMRKVELRDAYAAVYDDT